MQTYKEKLFIASFSPTHKLSPHHTDIIIIVIITALLHSFIVCFARFAVLYKKRNDYKAQFNELILFPTLTGFVPKLMIKRCYCTFLKKHLSLNLFLVYFFFNIVTISFRRSHQFRFLPFTTYKTPVHTILI